MASTIIIYGATGVVGSGIIKVFLQNYPQIKIVAPVRNDPSRLLKTLDLISTPENLLIPELPYLDEPEKLVQWVTQNIPGGKIDHVVFIAGGLVGQYSVNEITESILIDAIKYKVSNTISAYNALEPLLKNEETSGFTVVTGAAGTKCFYPAMGLLTIANASQFGVVQAIISQSSGKKYRVNEFRIASVIKHDADEENPRFKGFKAANTTTLANVFISKVFSSNASGEIVVVTGDDLN
eukprot:CAMPEP_0196762696 /NCGR_PEP_ID=MMETSP1095-20130614/2572_1 /TAXON_ID=96789 ORGANISM="Chromulina nebulosa, Strain UTEXLB2642" /NCGR_SAMPLE_ID=MMETSP1095 /ASSEMBLY_ACC=CAM_ASM_000446 /LENGTH=237 /DNA_ID=CAMNT_0042114259 /DNA_START=91 /DNA_END=804 /DNA_ORIENTATION=+